MASHHLPVPRPWLGGFVAAAALLLASPALAEAPDFNGDGRDDLAISVPGESVGGAANAGAVQVLYGSSGGLDAAGNQFWTQNSAGIPDAAEPEDGFGTRLAWGDFNGDGFDDLAVGAPTEGVGAAERAGALHVLYGSAAGLSATGTQFWTEETAGIVDTAETDDYFADRLVTGDFNGDGRDDLAIAAPGEMLGAVIGAGATHVLYGTPDGLTATGAQFWHQNVSGIADDAEDEDFFGDTLVTGDFNGDGRDDLVIGVPYEDSTDFLDSGAIHVLSGGVNGLTTTGARFLTQDNLAGGELAEDFDAFGERLHSADVTGDGRDDLLIGVPREDLEDLFVEDAGVLHLVTGGSTGLRNAAATVVSQATANIGAEPFSYEYFAETLASGDFNGDGFADVAVGVPADDRPETEIEGAGGAHILMGSATGFAAGPARYIHQDAPGFQDVSEPFEGFAEALVAGDFNGDTRTDLVIGVPRESVGAVPGAGAVHILYGSSAGLSELSQFWHQNSSGALEGAEVDDQFGLVLAAGDWNGAGGVDLCIGIPYEDIATVTDAGAVATFYGTANGLTAVGNQFWHQNRTGVLDAIEPFDYFGDLLR
jgi:hypothetical protein